MRSFALMGPESPRMSLTLEAVENNGLSPSLRRGAREGDFRDLCILAWHGGRRPQRTGQPAQNPFRRQLCKYLNLRGYRISVRAAQKQMYVGKRICPACKHVATCRLGDAFDDDTALTLARSKGLRGNASGTANITDPIRERTPLR